MDNPKTKMSKGCPHLEEYKISEGTKTYRIIHAIFVVRASAESRRTKVMNANCTVCHRIGPFMHACLHCVFFACHKHIRDHGVRHNHSVELVYGQIRCFKCNDYVYDTEMEKIAVDNKLIASVFRRRLFQWTSWIPSEEEMDLLKYKSEIVCITPESTIGLRGLLNLGSTCFMNCIVQALMHTPLLRDYFMTERHKCKRIAGTCLACDLSKLFQEFYKGGTVPLALHQFLYQIWTHAKHLAGYVQQDAHEFFIAILNVLHTHCLESVTPQKMISVCGSERCPCIIDQIFSGYLQSDLNCQKCNGISTTVDPLWDFSLELSPMDGKPPTSLTDCLERFTTAENLGCVTMCSYCKSYQQSTKQLTIKSLPIVVSFHLKRFQHTEKMAKISTLISFPEELDMTPFMSRAKTPPSIPSDNRYSLFAVINHLGSSINVGHYIAYVRQQRDYWYKCDDHKIIRANLKEVLDSEGYLLFYHKHVLAYE